MTEKLLTGYPSIDKPWLKYYSDEAINAPLPECTVYDYIYQNNAGCFNDVALEYFGCKITYEEMFARTEACVKALLANGVSFGDRINLCTSATPEVVYLVLACSKIGAVANFINPLFTNEQKIARINETESPWLFVMDKMADYILGIVPDTCIRNVVIIPATNSLPVIMQKLEKLKSRKSHKRQYAYDKYVLWNNFIKTGAACNKSEAAPYRKNTPVIMVYSSGTTGASKGIQLTNDGVNFVLFAFMKFDNKFMRRQKFLHIIPVWFSTGIVMNLLLGVYAGMTTILEPVFGVETFVNDLIKYKPTHMIVATSIWLEAAKHKKLRGKNFPYFVLPMTGGEALPEVSELYLNEFLKEKKSPVQLCKGYGMCELGSAVTAASDGFNKIGSVGIPLVNAIIAAFDIETGEELPYGKRGELRVVSPGRMLGYYKNAEATVGYFKTDEKGRVWGCTGDMGYVDEDGSVFVCGRITDTYLNRQNERIYLFDIENALRSSGKVQRCKVVVSEIDGQKTHVAHVLLEDNAGIESALLSIKQHCAKTLPTNHIPHFVKIYDDALPVAPSGKLNTVEMEKNVQGIIEL